MTPLIEVRQLRVQRGNKSVLEVDQLVITPGEVLALVGPNGAGKTTLLLSLARLIKPTQGKVIFHHNHDGTNSEISDTDLAYRRRIGLVMQDPLLLDQSVYDNVAIGLKFRSTHRDEIQKRVKTWLARLGIAPLKKRRAASLSGGEAQRVALARAFVLQPELLLLDEPFSALDAPTRARLLVDLKALLAETHITTVFVTHDLNDALTLGQRLAVMIRGSIRQIGAPGEVFQHPADAEVADFVETQRMSHSHF